MLSKCSPIKQTNNGVWISNSLSILCFLCSVVYTTVSHFVCLWKSRLIFRPSAISASDNSFGSFKPFLRTYCRSSLRGYGTYHAYVISVNWFRPYCYVETQNIIFSLYVFPIRFWTRPSFICTMQNSCKGLL